MKTVKMCPLACMGAAVLAASVALADTDYLELMVNSSTTAFYQGDQWEGGVLSSDFRYTTGYWFGLTAQTPSGTAPGVTTESSPLEFPGEELRIGLRYASKTTTHSRGYSTFHLGLQGAGYYNFARSGLTLSWGNVDIPSTAKGAVATVFGTLTFQGAASYPTAICLSQSDTHVKVRASVVSERGAVLDNAWSGSYARSDTSLEFYGDMSACEGEIRLSSVGAPLILGHVSEFPGTINIATNGALLKTSAKTDIVRIGTLAFKADTPTLYVDVDPYTGTNGQYVVGAVTPVDGAKLHVRASHYFVQTNGVPWQTGASDFYAPLITAPKGVLDVNDFVFDGFDWTSTYQKTDFSKPDEGGIFYRALQQGRLEVRPNGDGLTETLCLVHEPVEYYLGAGDVRSTDASLATSSIDNPEMWSDGQAPHPNAHYLVKYRTAGQSPSGKTASPILGTPWSDEDYVFGGKSLSVTTHLVINSSGSTTFDLLRVGGDLWVSRDGASLLGRYEVIPSPYANRITSNTVNVCEHKHFNFRSEIFGKDTILFSSTATGSWGGGAIDGSVELFGTNTNFTGHMTVTAGFRSGYPNGNVRLYLNDPRNLGGPMGAFSYRALELTQKASLRPRVSMTLDEPTRGLSILGEADILVTNDVTLAVKSPMTYAGVLTKKGAGTLALGSKPRFTDGNEMTAPTVGQNVLLVTEGYLRVDTPQALDNLAITVSDGAGLAFGAKPTGDVAATGLELANVSIEAETKVVVALDPTTFDGTEVTVPLFTGTRAQVDAMLAKCRFVRPARGWGKDLAFSGPDDRLTVSASYHPVGMAIILR